MSKIIKKNTTIRTSVSNTDHHPPHSALFSPSKSKPKSGIDPIDQPLKIKFRNPILQIVDGAADIEIGYLVHGASHGPHNGIPKVAGIGKPVDRVTDVLARPTAAQDEP